MTGNISWFKDLGLGDVESVGGKNASLGEMVQHLSKAGVRVPDGFATTADAYRRFLAHEGLADRISATLADLDVEDTRALAEAGAQIRDLVEEQPFPADLETDIRAAYEQLVAGAPGEVSWAVRSSATAEDMPDASFAGQQETFLNVTGDRQHPARDQEGLRLPLQRPRDRLPRAQQLRPRRRRAVGRRAADGALRHRLVRCDVHHRHRVRLPRRGVRHQQLRPRRGGRAGRGQPRRVLRLQARPARRAAPRSSSAASAARPPRWSTRRTPRWAARSTSCRSTRPTAAGSA